MDIDIQKVRFSYLERTNSMSGVNNSLQRRIQNRAPHAIYINSRCYPLALFFKNLFEMFPWLQFIDLLFLGLWKTFLFGRKNSFILKEIQKAAAKKWLYHGAICKSCRERYGMILWSLDDIITWKRRSELISYRDEF